MMDKLIDNAVSFSEPGTQIDVSLTEEGPSLTLEVVNRGSSLPATMHGQLFDSLVSIRERSDGRAHLGLGLYIVALIVEFHRGRIEARNLADGSGVVFRIELPRT
jgi:signal transduction histidine kinase